MFITAINYYAITKGLWQKVGKVSLEEYPVTIPPQFIQNPLNPEQFFIEEKGIRRPATKEECKGLERSSVWTPEGIQRRLDDYYNFIPTMISNRKKTMKSSQINFYLTPNDAEAINAYIHSNGWLIISQPMRENKLEFVDSILDRVREGKEIQSFKYLVRKEDQDLVIIKHVPTQNHYLIDSSNSPVVEFWYPPQNEKNVIRRGRVYYAKDYLDKAAKTEPLKNPEFLKNADDFFKWIRKNFKNAKLPGYEGLLVSENAAKWVKETGGELVLN
ncbi:MAG: hypothetical protein IPO06_22595 [Leptospiraceae bacterium]|nr:hypothetical protein [Leptospiraceae bacterium]